MYVFDKFVLISLSFLDEVLYYYDVFLVVVVDKEEKVVVELVVELFEEYVFIEKEVSFLLKVEVNDLLDLKIEEYFIFVLYFVDGVFYWGRSFSV